MSPVCLLCGAAMAEPLPGYAGIPPGGWDLWRCGRCRTAFLHPLPSAEELARAYDAEYYGQGPGKFAGWVEVLVRLFRWRRAALAHRLAPPGAVLDVGCGRGLMLARLARLGREVAGVELDTEAARRTAANVGVEPARSLDELAGRRFAAITFWHSLEHLPDPGRSLGQAAGMLAPRGALLAAVPNFASIQSRLAGPHWLHLDLPRHLCQFTPQGLRDVAGRHGLQLESEDHFSLEYNPIDTLCHLYRRLGFGPRYPFDAIRGLRAMGRGRAGLARLALAGALSLPLGPLALALSTAFSAAGSGSTVTLVFRKGATAC